MSNTAHPSEIDQGYRVVSAFIVASWMISIGHYYHAYLYYRDHPIVYEFFPSFLSRADILPALYLLPCIASLVAVLWANWRFRVAQALIVSVCSAILCLHQVGFAIQSFPTTFWVSLWLLWIAVSASKEQTLSILPRARFLGLATISFLFIGACAGKWTAGYWSGEVFFHLMFRYQDYFHYRWLRAHFTMEEIRQLATWYSRLAIVGESVLATVVLMPPKIGFRVATIGLIGLWIFSTPVVFNAMGSALGLAIAGWLLCRAPTVQDNETS